MNKKNRKNMIDIISENDINMYNNDNNNDFEIIDMPNEIKSSKNDNNITHNDNNITHNDNNITHNDNNITHNDNNINHNDNEFTSEELKIHESFTDEFLQNNIHLIFKKLHKRTEIQKIYTNLLSGNNKRKGFYNNLKIIKEELQKDYCPNLNNNDIKSLKKIKIRLNHKYGKYNIINTVNLSNTIENILKELLLYKHEYETLTEKTCYIIYDYICDDYHEVDILMIILISEYNFLKNMIDLLLKHSNENNIKKVKKSVFNKIIKKIF